MGWKEEKEKYTPPPPIQLTPEQMKKSLTSLKTLYKVTPYAGYLGDKTVPVTEKLQATKNLQRQMQELRSKLPENNPKGFIGLGMAAGQIGRDTEADRALVDEQVDALATVHNLLKADLTGKLPQHLQILDIPAETQMRLLTRSKKVRNLGAPGSVVGGAVKFALSPLMDASANISSGAAIVNRVAGNDENAEAFTQAARTGEQAVSDYGTSTGGKITGQLASGYGQLVKNVALPFGLGPAITGVGASNSAMDQQKQDYAAKGAVPTMGESAYKGLTAGTATFVSEMLSKKMMGVRGKIAPAVTKKISDQLYNTLSGSGLFKNLSRRLITAGAITSTEMGEEGFEQLMNNFADVPLYMNRGWEREARQLTKGVGSAITGSFVQTLPFALFGAAYANNRSAAVSAFADSTGMNPAEARDFLDQAWTDAQQSENPGEEFRQKIEEATNLPEFPQDQLTPEPVSESAKPEIVPPAPVNAPSDVSGEVESGVVAENAPTDKESLTVQPVEQLPQSQTPKAQPISPPNTRQEVEQSIQNIFPVYTKDGIKKTLESFGADGTYSPGLKTWLSQLNQAKAEKLDEKADILATLVEKEGHALSPTEMAGMVLRANQLRIQYKELITDLNASNLVEANRVEAEFERILKAIRTSRSQVARTLGMRLSLDDNYDLLSVTNRAAFKKGEALNETEKAKFQQLTDELARKDAQLAEYKQREEERMSKEHLKGQAAYRVRRMSKAQLKTERAKLTQQAKELLEAGC